MQVSVESTGTLKREMKVTVPEDRIANEVLTRLNSLSKRTKIDGFRKGKIPFKVIENRYSKQVRQEVVGEVVQSSYYEALQQEKLVPAGRPNIDMVNSELGEGLSYIVVFEIMPEVKLSSLDSLVVDKPACEIDEDDYQSMVEVLRSQNQNLERVDRLSKTGDTLDIDFEGYIDGELFEGGSSKDFKLELGQNKFIDGFESGLEDKKSGEKVTLELVFPDNYHKETLSGKPVRFDVTINEILEPVLPELNDEFYKKFGIEEGSVDAFKKQVSDHMRQEADAAIRNRLRDEVMDKLFVTNSMEIPETLVHEEIHRLQHQFQEKLKSYGLDPKSQQEIPTDHAAFEKQAQKRVSLQLIVMELIREHELKADPSKVRQLIEKNASNYEDPEQMINWYYQDKQRLSEIEGIILEDEVIDLICKNATVNSTNVKFDDLMNKGQTG
ncbi:MAG: trigger factor [Gammaproteobacteria bacterium]|jgi:trigger factor